MSLDKKDIIEHLIHESESDIESIRDGANKELEKMTIKENTKMLKEIKYKITKKHNIIEMPDGFKFYLENRYEHLEAVINIFKETWRTQINGKKYMNWMKLWRWNKLFILKVEMTEDWKRDVWLFNIKVIDEEHGDIEI